MTKDPARSRSERSADLSRNINVFVHASPHSGSEVLSCYRGRTFICSCRRGRPRRGRSGPGAGCLRQAAVLRTACPTACLRARHAADQAHFLFAHNISGIASQDKGFACPAWRSMHIYLDMQAQLIYRSCYLQSTASAADLSDLDAQMIGGTDALMMTTTTMRSRFR
jgi:hypothetical protein